MFALGEIALLVALGWLITRVFRAANRNAYRRIEERPHPPLEPGAPVQRSVTEEIGPRERSSLGGPAVPGPRSRDERIADLRRRYVADEITVEEYEAELDRLLKGP
jgi:hypothetical protein